jgi:hypothetical protein
MRDTFETIKANLKSGKGRIKDYCDFVRNDVDSAADSRIELINKWRNGFMEEIDKYQKECLDNYDRLDENIAQDYEPLIDSSQAFHQEWTDYFGNFILDDSKLLVAIDEAEEYLLKLKTEELNLKSEIFSGKMIKFEESATQMEAKSALGQLKFGNIKGLLSLNLDEVKSLSLINKLNGTANEFVKVSTLSNQNFVVAYQNSGLNVNSFTIDHQGQFKIRKRSN